ncbi:MAG TPA: hypothetical protein PKI03_37215 [Pseudomonadota bacterium]|nr:hypothetical protein [Pseudomonadota bacterium]
MARERTPALAERCPNCNAFVPPPPAGAKERRCEYCGLALRVEPTPPPAPLIKPAPIPPLSTAGVGRVWPSLLVPLLVGGSIYWSTQRSIERTRRQVTGRGSETTSPPSRSPLLAPLLGDSADPGAGPDSAAPTGKSAKNPPTADRRSRARLPVGDASLRNELCHISGMEMSAVVHANQRATAACFTQDLVDYPKNVGLTSDWEVELDGLGKVHAAKGRLHLLDYNRSPEERAQKTLPLPGPAALRCAQEIIRGWEFPKYSPKDGARMRMHCSFNLVIRDT